MLISILYFLFFVLYLLSLLGACQNSQWLKAPSQIRYPETPDTLLINLNILRILMLTIIYLHMQTFNIRT